MPIIFRSILPEFVSSGTSFGFFVFFFSDLLGKKGGYMRRRRSRLLLSKVSSRIDRCRILRRKHTLPYMYLSSKIVRNISIFHLIYGASSSSSDGESSMYAI